MFVMLLSFFIVLNSMSTFEPVKARPILNSLSMAFSSQEIDEKLTSGIEDSGAQGMREGGDTLEKIDGLFSAQISGLEVRKNRLGTMMHMRVPVKKFDALMGTMVQNEDAKEGSFQQGFLQTLVSLLDAENSIPYRMDIVLNVEANPAKFRNDSPEETAQKIEKVSYYAKALQEAGLPPKLETAGLGKGEDGMIDLYFHRYVPFNPEGSKE